LRSKLTIKSTEKCKKYYTKNKQLSFWIPVSLNDWFKEYLNRVSYGSSFAEKVRVFLYRLQELDEQGITIACMSPA
jgi:hypothetical protein